MGKITKAEHIKDYLDRFIVGQENAKRIVSTVAFMSHIRVLMKKIGKRAHELPNPNLLLLGPTGCGKTYMIKKLAELMDRNVMFLNATSLTPDGYAGTSLTEHIEEEARRLYGVNPSPEVVTWLLQNSIVFIDEIDKLGFEGSTSKGNDFHVQIQNNLLTLIEGTELNVSKPNLKIDTSEMLVICAGSFEKIQKGREAKKNVKQVGFVKENPPEIDPELVHKELIEAGIIPELAGRFPVVGELEKLTEDEIREVLYVNGSEYSKYRAFFKIFNEEPSTNDVMEDNIVKQVAKNSIGLRGMNQAIYTHLKDQIWNLDLEETVKEITKGTGYERRET